MRRNASGSILFALVLLLAGCASAPEQPQNPPSDAKASPPASPPPSSSGPPATGKGGYYKDDGPGEKPPPNLADIPDAVPKAEPAHRYANRPYQVFGKDYTPMASAQPYRERGTASWYGKKFHGQKTSSGEIYDMYAMSAAHRTLPIPSYARVTNVANGKSVVVRINDRGPFHSDRIIDLSYAAAYKLGYIQAGSATVEVESVQPGDSRPSSVYLQVGAFSSKENAEDYRAQVSRQLAWLTEQVQVLTTREVPTAGEVPAAGGLWRLLVGPYGSNDAARSAAARIETELNLKPLLVVR
jgi:rare lipoprotein A